MKTKRVSALIMAIIMCFAVIQPSVFASDELKLTVLDATAGNGNDVISNLVDGNKKTSWGMNWWNGKTTAYAVIKASRQVTPKGYALTTGEDAISYKNRNPRDWKLYGCNDYDEASKTGGEWILLHTVKNDNRLENINSKTYNYDLDNDMAFNYYKLEITANKGNNYLKVCEFELLETVTVNFEAVDGKASDNSGEDYENLFDNNNGTKYCVKTGDLYVVAKSSRETVVTGYTFTTGNDTQSESGRNPKSWVLYGSNDYNETSKEGTWSEVNSVTNDATMQAKNYASYSFAVENNTAAYKYYKFKFNEVQGGELMQLSEIKFEYSVPVHTWTNVEKVAPSCTKAGAIKQTCADCGNERTLEIAALGHNWAVERREEATCTEVGHIYYKCSRCEAAKTEEIPTIEHDWTEVKREEATCTEIGHIYYKCSRCEAAKTEEIPSTGHKLTESIIVNPTCTETGLAEKRCSECDFTEQTVLPKLGHIAGDDGKCKNCGEYAIKAGDKYYLDLQTAINEVQSATIELCQDIYIETALKINGDRTIDLKGYTIKQTGSDGVITVNSGVFTLKDTSKARTGTLCGNKTSGGGVYIAEKAEFDMIGGTISDCTASDSGGGIYVQNNAKLSMSGGATIKNCTAPKLHGGGIMNYGTAEIKDSNIINCSANTGGGIYADGGKAGGKLDLYNTVIEGCSAATNGGGGICADSTGVSVNENSKIRKNTASSNYGAGILATDQATVTVNNSEITENTANEGAGILANIRSNIILNNSEIKGNNANSAGGGVMLSYSTLVIESGSIGENITSGNGGGVYAINSASIEMKGGSINDNKAQWGGGVYLHYGSEMTLSEGSDIRNNTAEYNGGGIIINDSNSEKNSTLNMTGGNVSYNEAVGNTSDGNGGGICGQKKAVINISGGSIDNNKAVNGGGIALLNKSALSSSGTADISQNTAKLSGGGVYINSQSDMTLSGRSRIAQNNSSEAGGGIYAGGKLSVSGTPQVSGNDIVLSETETGETNVVKSNIYLPSGKTISASNITDTMVDKWLITPELYFTAADGTADITDSCEDFSDYFFSDNIDYAVAYKDGVIKLVAGHKVTFVYEGERMEVYAVADGYTVKEPEGEPWQEGYTFVGWLYNGKDYNFNTPVTGNMTLTPKWVKNGSTALSINYGKFYAIDVNQNAKIYLAAYDSSGKLIDLWVETINENYYPTSRAKSFKEVGLSTAGADKVTVMLWSEDMQPLCSKATIKLN